jgi:RNA polymerase sigma-70 factor (ECF subfamily)
MSEKEAILWVSLMLLPFQKHKSRNLEGCYAEHAPALLAYARSFGLNHHAAEDLLHHVFLKVLEGPTDKDVQEIRPYLFRAIRNSALNHQRDHSREVEFSGQEPWFRNPGTSLEAELDLSSALCELPLEQREVLLMHIWGGLTFGEIASVLADSPNTVASRYRYALNAMKRRLQPRVEVKEP